MRPRSSRGIRESARKEALGELCRLGDEYTALQERFKRDLNTRGYVSLEARLMLKIADQRAERIFK